MIRLKSLTFLTIRATLTLDTISTAVSRSIPSKRFLKRFGKNQYCIFNRLGVELGGTIGVTRMYLFAVMDDNTGGKFAFLYFKCLWMLPFFSRILEDFTDGLFQFRYEDIRKITGCIKPCKYFKYAVSFDQPTIVDSPHYTFSVVVSFTSLSFIVC